MIKYLGKECCMNNNCELIINTNELKSLEEIERSIQKNLEGNYGHHL